MRFPADAGLSQAMVSFSLLPLPLFRLYHYCQRVLASALLVNRTVVNWWVFEVN